MVEVKLKKLLKLDDLKEGEIFDDSELIIYNDGESMETLVRELNYLGHGKKSQISRRHYDLSVSEESVIKRINYNRYNEFPTDGKEHEKFNKMLSDRVL